MKREILVSSAAKLKAVEAIYRKLAEGEALSYEDRRVLVTGHSRYQELKTLDMILALPKR